MRRIAILVTLVSTLAMATPAQTQGELAQLKQQFVGSFKLISYTSFDEKGTATRLPYSVGQISYDAAGRMSAQLMREDRTRLPQRASEAERAAAYSGYIAYFGHYVIDPGKRTVTHHVDGALSPNMVGTPQVRHFEFSPDGATLFLSVKNGDRVTGKLQWDRHPVSR
jgi:hypothetical protein